jgi:hypothetical protein
MGLDENSWQSSKIHHNNVQELALSTRSKKNISSCKNRADRFLPALSVMCRECSSQVLIRSLFRCTGLPESRFLKCWIHCWRRWWLMLGSPCFILVVRHATSLVLLGSPHGCITIHTEFLTHAAKNNTCDKCGTKQQNQQVCWYFCGHLHNFFIEPVRRRTAHSRRCTRTKCTADLILSK